MVKKPEEQRIYVAVAGTVQVPANRGMRTVIQVPGRQIAQACHVVSKLRQQILKLDIPEEQIKTPELQQRLDFVPITTIILQARDSAELLHVQMLLHKKKLNPAVFFDTNPEVYGNASTRTAVAVLATKSQVELIMDYLPLWGAE